jgi:proline dehydrogenase
MIRALASQSMQRLLAQVAKRYVAGPTLADGCRVAQRYRDQGLATTLGYWDQEGEPPTQVQRECLQATEGLTPPDYVSIKLTALGGSEALLEPLAALALARGVRLHFDAMGPETAQATRDAVQRLVARHGSALQVGYTLPGRWRRSVDDAAWASELGLAVRIVKGQFPDADQLDPFAGYLAVARALAGRKAPVGVATHNPALCDQATRSLLEAGTPTTLEQLHGLPMRRQRALAQARGLPTTVYVAYGQAYLPYVVSSVMRNPLRLLPLARQLLPF